jgi:hypothetical protein
LHKKFWDENPAQKNGKIINKGISTATASRDLKQLLLEGKIESTGEGRMAKYKRTVN